jgi:hypothetical protein
MDAGGSAALAALSASAHDGAEIPVRQEEQVPASHVMALRSDCYTPDFRIARIRESGAALSLLGRCRSEAHHDRVGGEVAALVLASRRAFGKQMACT